ncbi:hypothetical protein [Ruminococcus sp.]
MASIIYMKSKAGYDNCFAIGFSEKEVIPPVFYESGEYGAVLRFFADMLRKEGMMDENENGTELIWCREYPCRFGNIPFTMIYDMDYDTVSFSVEPENCKYRDKIAEKLLSLTEAAE